MIENEDLVRILLLPKINYVLSEVKEIAYLIKDLKAKNLQEVIDYEDMLNKFSNIDYDKERILE